MCYFVIFIKTLFFLLVSHKWSSTSWLALLSHRKKVMENAELSQKLWKSYFLFSQNQTVIEHQSY